MVVSASGVGHENMDVGGVETEIELEVEAELAAEVEVEGDPTLLSDAEPMSSQKLSIRESGIVKAPSKKDSKDTIGVGSSGGGAGGRGSSTSTAFALSSSS